MLNYLLNGYMETTAAALYFFGFVFHGLVYGGYFTDIPHNILYLDHTSSARGACAKIRIRFDKAAKLNLIEQGKVKLIGTEKDLYTLPKYNKGDNFERLLATIYNIPWKKNCNPYWMDGDLTIYDIKIQCKFDGAELVTEKSLMKAKEEVA